ncbi:MAG TPA: NlpC/P60 family protein [Acidimicrobiales bacterium]
MSKFVVGAGIACAGIVVALIVTVVAVASAGTSGSGGSPGASPTPGGPADSGGGAAGSGGVDASPAVPADWVNQYRLAAATCPGLSWSVLAGIGTVETDNGQSNAPGVWSGSNSAGAEGPMQFEPATFAADAVIGPGGAQPASPYDPIDAIYTAAKLLCSNGAGTTSGLRAAVFDYNHSDTYVNTVLALSIALADTPTADGTVIGALRFAAEKLNTPYVWGGTGNGGFDCSGLTQAAYQAGGISLPRVAQDQYDAGPPVTAAQTVQPGDLVFFGDGPNSVDHVGLYVGGGEMIDAPHTGANVRFDNADWPGLVGVTRPAG